MEWFDDLGVMLQFMPDTPALAFDMTTSGPKYDAFKYSLAYNMQNSPTGLEIYPQTEGAFPGGE
jgi:hypothetical protein